MFIPFEQLPQNARVWVYPLNRDLNAEEQNLIAQKLKTFVESWEAHGHELKASYQIAFNRFIILAADEQYHAPSGCSIDNSVNAVKGIVRSAGLELADRGQVFFLINNTIQGVVVTRLRKYLEEGKWNAGTPVFDTSVNTFDELGRNPVPAGNTWLVRYLTQVSV